MAPPVEIGDWRIDADRHRLLDASGSGREVRLEPKAMQVLVCLADRRGKVVAKEEIVREVWGDAFVSDQVLTNAIWELRRALGDDARTQRWIQTVPREGYRLAQLSVGEAPTPSTRSTQIPLGARGPRLRVFLVALVILVALALPGWWLWTLLRGPAAPSLPPEVTRFSVDFEEPLASFHLPVAALSHDGTRLVFVSLHEGTTRLFLRRMDRLDATPLDGTEGAHGPFFSPDDEWIGFFSLSELRKVPAQGGLATSVHPIATPRGATWGEDGAIYVSPASSSGIWKIPDFGEGEPEQVTTLEDNEWSHRWPEVPPGAQAILFTVADEAVVQGFDQARIFAQSLHTGERKLLVEGGTFPRYVSGHLVFVRGADLLAAPLDLDRLELTGTPRPVLRGVRRFPINGAAQFALSPNGTLAYVPGAEDWEPPRRLLRVTRDGKETVQSERERLYYDPALSPDGRRLAVVIAEQGNSDLWIVDLDGGGQTRLTDSPGEEQGPVWAPDGQRIAYYYSLHGPFQMFWKAADGSGEAERLLVSEHNQRPESFSPDGRTLVFSELHPETGFDLWTLTVPPPGTKVEGSDPRPLLRTRFDERHARVSPDGRWLAHVSDESGASQIYLRPFGLPGSSGGKTLLSPEGGSQPLWDASGSRLTYRTADVVMEVELAELAPGSSQVAGTPRSTPRVLFPWHFPLRVFESPYRRDFDAFPDGDLLMIRPRTAERRRLHVVLGWSEELTAGGIPLR